MNRTTVFLSGLLLLLFLDVSGQPDVSTMNLKHPAVYENRQLAAEKTPDIKFSRTRRFIQDNVTHYNYYFNANNKLAEIIARAKAKNKDDYSKLLPFYNFSLENTSGDKRELDSVIYKCTAGVLIHDLRNDWIDNLYMLMGQSYFYLKKPDSAIIAFQFVNYAYAPREEGDYHQPIGSNANKDGNAYIISTKEKRNIIKRALTLPPSRNESFIWLIRSYISENAMSQAAALIEILKLDPSFPKRLQGDLTEVQALWFYKQEMYDSATVYLERSLGNTNNDLEKARWQYLIAQMYERLNKTDQAREYFQKVFAHTYDPVMEVYARLNYIRLNHGNDQIILANIDALVKMAKKDRYEEYRDIIYYTIAQIELERKDIPDAVGFLLKSVKYTQPFSTQKSKGYLLLANISFDQKKYKEARNYYDSVNIKDGLAVENPDLILDRKKTLDKIVEQIKIIERQDSLQRIAGMPPAERDAFIKKLVKILRRQEGLKDEEPFPGSSPILNQNNNIASPVLFNSSPDNSEWYFNNETLKSQGYTDFKTKWGTRQNVDNWQVSALAVMQISRKGSTNIADNQGSAENSSSLTQTTFATLLARLPLTPEKMKVSSDSLDHALFTLGRVYQDGLPDYNAAIESYERLITKFPASKTREETLFNLYYCYKKIGDDKNADRILTMMREKYPNGKLTAILVNPASAIYAANAPKIEATRKYESIYNAFIEGNFDDALEQKKIADSIYGKKYWTPQLLFIESIYLIKQRQDDAAKTVLNNIINEFAGSPMAAKAKIFLDVLNKRRQIEDYLTHLQVTRAKEDSLIMNASPSTAGKVTRKEPTQQDLERGDSTQLKKAKISVATQLAVDQKAGNGKSALDNLKMNAAQAAKMSLDSTELFSMRRQMDSLQLAMKRAQLNSALFERLKKQTDSIATAMKELKADSLDLANRTKNIHSAFGYTPERPHSVIVLITKVDPVYVTETKNAFNRFNNESLYNRSLNVSNSSFTDTTKMVIISGFENATAALDYLNTAKKEAARDIIPWLPANKYSFIIITEDNLALLKSNLDLPAYQKFLSAYFPGKF